MGATWQERLLSEYADLKQRLISLERFIETDPYWDLDAETRNDLHDQRNHMRQYYLVLFRRVARLDASQP